MRGVLILLLFSCLVSLSLSRPPGLEDQSNDSNETEDMDYEGEDDAADDFDDDVTEEKESRASFEPSEGAGYRFFGQKSEENKPKATNSLNISEIQVPNQLNEDSNSEHEGRYDTGRSSGQYSEQNNDANDQQEISQHFPNRDVNNYKETRHDGADNERKVNKRTEEHNRAAEGNLLFEMHDKKAEYDNLDDPSENYIGLSKQDFKTMDAEHIDSRFDHGNNENVNYNRGRRQAQSSDKDSKSVESKGINEAVNEDEESAIKRHVKKLTSDEYDQLLNSLSDDKRILLKKIMDGDSGVENGYDNMDSIKKREITKKMGAVEDNNILESGQIDLNKVVSSIPNIDDNAETTLASTETNKETDTEQTKAAESSTITDAKREIVAKREGKEEDKSKEAKLELSSTPEPRSDATMSVASQSDSQVTKKSANKREVNFEDFNDADESAENILDYNADLTDSELDNDQGYSNEQEEELSNDKISEPIESNIQKRDTSKQTDTQFAESMQSLEDSFPNPNAYDNADPYSGSKMTPLVRVKRAKKNDIVIKKRAAGVLPEAKVAFFPDRAETEDEDNEEANEFDNEGFYDHYAENNEKSEDDSSESEHLSPSRQCKSDNVAPTNENAIVHSNIEALDSDSVGIGSDTDSVLSGVEGVDDNLMFSNVARDRRSEDTNKNSDFNEFNRENEEAAKVNERHHEFSDLHAPEYQINDAFGPLPRNYEGELSRYKRVRRVKHSPSRH